MTDVRYERGDRDEKLGPPPWDHNDPWLLAWEQAHGHDIRLTCQVEYGCRLIERDLEEAEAKLARVLELCRVSAHEGNHIDGISVIKVTRVRAAMSR